MQVFNPSTDFSPDNISLSLSLSLHLQGVAKDIEEQLSLAREENEKLSNMMGAIGVNPRPTIAQWLQRKQIERKAKLQDSLISWDTSKGWGRGARGEKG